MLSLLFVLVFGFLALPATSIGAKHHYNRHQCILFCFTDQRLPLGAGSPESVVTADAVYSCLPSPLFRTRTHSSAPSRCRSILHPRVPWSDGHPLIYFFSASRREIRAACRNGVHSQCGGACLRQRHGRRRGPKEFSKAKNHSNSAPWSATSCI